MKNFSVALALLTIPLSVCSGSLSAFSEDSVASLCVQAANANSKFATRHQAEAIIDRALKLAPNDATVLAIKGLILQTNQEDQEGLKYVERALAINPKLAMAWNVRAGLLSTMKRSDEALASANKAIALQPLMMHINTKARILETMGRFEEAEMTINQSLAKSPTSPLMLGMRAEVRTRLKKWQGVIEDSNAILKNDAKISLSEIAILEYRANAYMQLKQYDKAIADYKLATRRMPDKRQSWEGLVIAYKLTGKPKEAAAAQATLNALDDDMRPMR